MALGDDGVGPAPESNLRLLHRADLDHNLDANATCLADPVRRISPEEHDDRWSLLDASLDHAVAYHPRAEG
jgi:hypothetical protein